MDLWGLLTCRRCYYGGDPVLFLCIFPEASKADGLPIAPGDVKGLLLATWTFLPLVVTGCGHDAAAALKASRKAGLLERLSALAFIKSGSFSPGLDQKGTSPRLSSMSGGLPSSPSRMIGI
jgi:hypothetical protein